MKNRKKRQEELTAASTLEAKNEELTARIEALEKALKHATDKNESLESIIFLQLGRIKLLSSREGAYADRAARAEKKLQTLQESQQTSKPKNRCIIL
jgi:translation initiation factor 2B subunit (eIF-2B alpha/beta/delta family)